MLYVDRLDGMDGGDGMVIMGHRSSKSTFDAYSFFISRCDRYTELCLFVFAKHFMERGDEKRELK